MEQYNSITYLQELNIFRPLTKSEETWLNNYGIQITCSMCDHTFANEDQLRNHFYERLNCQEHWTRKKKKFLDEIKLFRQMSTEEHGWLEIHYPYTCEICHEKFAVDWYLKTHIVKYSKVKPWRGSKVEFDECGLMFHTELDWQNHKRKPHDHTCKKCSLKFVRKFELIHHIDNIHTTDEVEVGEISICLLYTSDAADE